MATMDQTPSVVTRVGRLLRVVGSLEPAGGTTTDVARIAGIARPSAHRLLSSLADEGLIDRDSETGRWSLGPELYLLGSAASVRYDITEHARDIVQSLSEQTGESAFLSALRGEETVCLMRYDGSFPLRSHVLHEGIRFPLGVASAGLAILAHLSEHEIAEYVSRSDLGDQWGSTHDASHLMARVEETRRAGYATNPALLVEGSWGMGAAVFSPSGRPEWALSLTGVETRFRTDRRKVLGEHLLKAAHDLSRKIATLPRYAS